MVSIPRKQALRILIGFVLCKSCNGFQSLPRPLRRPLPTSERRIKAPRMTPESIHSIHSVSDLLSIVPGLNPFAGMSLPFGEMGQQLSNSLDIGANFRQATGEIPEEETRLVLGSVGSDILVFLSASVVVTTIANALGITPILGYLVVGALLGPNAANIFSNAQAGLELGDFGILFLLFSEGLEVTRSRLQKLTNYLPLGCAQISLTTGVLTTCLLLFGRYVPIDTGFFNINDPIQAVVLAFTGALSTSAFIFPVLKERGWEEEPSGESATTILLLQDLLVAPLLVLLPYLVGSGPTDYTAISFLTFKATVGFGAVIVAGSYFLRWLFRLVSQTRSSETFVALCLLVSVGMGEIAKSLGLTDTAGAFAAGVLLANTNYRAQIQADILPFKGILLGIFFMGAGSNFDLDLVVREWPTVLGGAVALIAIKAVTLFVATKVPKKVEPNRLSTVDAIRISVLLAGGGEFAFVVLALAEKIDILSQDLIGLLTAIVLVTMGVTPLLGDLATFISKPFVEEGEQQEVITNGQATTTTKVAEDAIVVCGHAEAGRAVLRVLAERQGTTTKPYSDEPRIVAFSRNPALADSVLLPGNGTIVLYGDGQNPEVLRSNGITRPRAIFVTYDDHNRALSATARLRAAFPDAPIYARAAKRREARNLQLAGATEGVVECDELARAVPLLIKGEWDGPLNDSDYDSKEDFRVAAAAAARISLEVVDDLFELYDSLDMCATGLLGRDELVELFRKTKKGFIASDQQVKQMETWLSSTSAAHMDPMDKVEFCRMYGRAPDFVKASFGNIRNFQG